MLLLDIEGKSWFQQVCQKVDKIAINSLGCQVVSHGSILAVHPQSFQPAGVKPAEDFEATMPRDR